MVLGEEWVRLLGKEKKKKMMVREKIKGNENCIINGVNALKTYRPWLSTQKNLLLFSISLVGADRFYLDLSWEEIYPANFRIQ